MEQTNESIEEKKKQTTLQLKRNSVEVQRLVPSSSILQVPSSSSSILEIQITKKTKTKTIELFNF